MDDEAGANSLEIQAVFSSCKGRSVEMCTSFKRSVKCYVVVACVKLENKNTADLEGHNSWAKLAAASHFRARLGHVQVLLASVQQQHSSGITS